MGQPLALIIEDDRRLSRIFVAALTSVGFDTEFVLDGGEAQARIKDVDNPVPRLILLDLHLPHVSGAEILETIRAQSHLEGCRVMIVTADLVEGESVRKDADLLLIKPVSVTQLQLLLSLIHI